MTELPCCRLCNAPPQKGGGILTNKKGVYCSTFDCPCRITVFTEGEWRKLMYVPEKMTYMSEMTHYQIGEVDGYNAAIDDMIRGGE